MSDNLKERVPVETHLPLQDVQDFLRIAQRVESFVNDNRKIQFDN